MTCPTCLHVAVDCYRIVTNQGTIRIDPVRSRSFRMIETVDFFTSFRYSFSLGFQERYSLLQVRNLRIYKSFFKNKFELTRSSLYFYDREEWNVRTVSLFNAGVAIFGLVGEQQVYSIKLIKLISNEYNFMKYFNFRTYSFIQEADGDLQFPNSALEFSPGDLIVSILI